ncbi:MAG TPA: SpoIIE family protein phosphatase, partial [Ignavibacteriaceae bacterium]|nr:SpoIIE family protein phosphatase [Ignavibacteriaceae bacterium]
PSEKLPLALAIKGEKIINEIIFINNPIQTKGVYISVTAGPVQDSNDMVTGGIVMLRDITENKYSEIALKQSNQKFQSLFKGFPIPSYVWRRVDNGFTFVDYNESAEVFSKNSIKKYLGKTLVEMYSDSPHLRNIQLDFLKCFNEKRKITRKRPYKLLATGEVKEVLFNYVFIHPDLILIHTEDITEQKKSLNKLKVLSNAIEQTADSVVITDIKGIIEYVNPAFETTTGYNNNEILGKTPRVLKSGEHGEETYKKLWTEIIKGKTFKGTIINKKKNGELYWSQQTITPMKDEYGDISNFVSVLRDITELKKQQEQEFQIQIAHELQQKFFNTKISVPGFDIAGASYSAVKTCGDYFDFILMKDGSIGIIIGDVCGHGIGAALIMAETRAYLRAIAKMEHDPGAILTLLNKELALDLDDNHFVTLIFGRLDPNNSSFDYASAGHLPIYLLNDLGEIKITMESNGIPLGIIHDYKYVTSEKITLISKDLLAFLTDGLVEAKSNNEIELGFDGVLEIIKRYQDSDSKKIIENLYNATISFTKNQVQEDDITSIICKVIKQ